MGKLISPRCVRRNLVTQSTGHARSNSQIIMFMYGSSKHPTFKAVFAALRRRLRSHLRRPPRSTLLTLTDSMRDYLYLLC